VSNRPRTGVDNAALALSLAAGLETLALAISEAAQRGMIEFIALLVKWNRAFNLTAVTEPQRMVSHHLLDSLAIMPYVRGPRVIDVGTGAGLPGIPLALALPQFHFVLLDSNGKKTRFVTQAVGELGLANVEVVQARVDEYQPGVGFDSVISRAFATMEEMLRATAHLAAPHGRLLAMKGRAYRDELARLPQGCLIDAHRLVVPGIEGERYLVELAPSPPSI